MILSLQIKSLVISFLFGIIFSINVNINYKFLYNEYKLIRFLFTFIFIIVHVLLYFIILMKINNGYYHIYLILAIIVGFTFEFLIHKKLFGKIAFKYKKWYT